MLEGLQKILVISYAFSSLPRCEAGWIDDICGDCESVCYDICGDRESVCCVVCEPQSPLYQFNVM